MSDFTNPIIKDLSPAPGSVNNSNDSVIEATLDDGYGSGIDLSSITVTVNGTFAIHNGVIQSGFTNSVINSVTSTQVQLQVDRDQSYNDLESVNVSVSAKDLSGNPASTKVFSFITEDNSDAVIVNPTPERDAIQVATSSEIFFNIRRTPRETKLDRNSIRVSLTGYQRDSQGNPIETIFVEPDGYGQLLFDQREVAIVPDNDGLGFSVTIIPLQPLPPASLIEVDIQVLDLAGNLTQESYSFATVDQSAPYVVNQVPSPNSTSNSIGTSISFSIGDSTDNTIGSGIRLDSIDIEVDQQEVVINGIIQSGFSGLITQNQSINGYDVVLTKDTLFSPRKTIPIQITATDFSNNTLRENYAFSTEDVTPPQIIFVYPKDQSLNVPQDAIVILNIESEVAVEEIDLLSLEVKINGIIALSNNSFQPGFAGSLFASGSKTLSVTIKTEQPFLLGSTIPVDVNVSDIFGNSISDSSSFKITSLTSLESIATPPGGIYDPTGNTSFPIPTHGSFLAVNLQSNKSNALIAYTVDGSDPIIDIDHTGLSDGYGLGTTKVFDPLSSSSIKFPVSETGILRYFAFDPIEKEIEKVNTDVYSFSSCPEEDKWDDTSLRVGLEYTDKVTFNKSQFVDNVVTNSVNEKIGTVNYIHDLGRSSYIDNLLFNTYGISNFRVRVADTKEQLRTADWCNSSKGLAIGNFVTFIDGYGPKVSLQNQLTHIEGRNQTEQFFSDEAVVQLDEELGTSFGITGEFRLPIDLRTVVGSKAFFRLFDDVFNLEVQQYISKVNAESINQELLGQSSLIGEIPLVFIDGYQIPDNYDGYLISNFSEKDKVTDGESGFVTLETPPVNKTESIQFMFREIVPIEDELVLDPETTDVFNIFSSTPSVYNTFKYNQNEVQTLSFTDIPNSGYFTLSLDGEVTNPIAFNVTAANLESILEALSNITDITVTGDFQNDFVIEFAPGTSPEQLQVEVNTLRINFTAVDIVINTLAQGAITYSSAKIGVVHYKNFPTEEKSSFAIPVIGKPLDNTLAEVYSLNLDAELDQYVFAETNDIFTGIVRLSEGDYNFRFSVTYLDSQNQKATRQVANPFIFKTREDLSPVQAGDFLVVGTNKYQIQSIVLTTANEYIIEFEESFPPQPVDINIWTIERNNTTIINPSLKITVLNPLDATIGTDASGVVSNIVIDTSKDVEFTYVSSSAIEVSVIGTFNNFNPSLDILKEGSDPLSIEKLFDLDYSDPYQNSHTNFHKVVINPLLPTIVDRVRFYTDVDQEEKQRTRLIIDDQPISEALYKATKQNGNLANYIPQDGYNDQEFEEDLDLEEELEALPELIVINEDQQEVDEILSSTDLYSSAQDGFIEWNYVTVGNTENDSFRDKIELLTRFDSYSGNSRKHVELEIYTLPNLPQFVSDFVAYAGARNVIRRDKTGFAALSNNVSVDYAKRRYLENIPIALTKVEDDGIVNNFFRATIETGGLNSNQVYVDTPHIFKSGEKVIGVTLDGSGSIIDITRTEVVSISTDGSGLITFADSIVQSGHIVKDYTIEETVNDFRIKLEVPDFTVVFYQTIFDFFADPEKSIIRLENTLNVDPTTLVGGKFTYPLLSNPARIIEATTEQEIVGSEVKDLLKITIDTELLITQDELGCVIETFNDTKIVTDYILSKTDGEVLFTNQSLLGSGENTIIDYEFNPIPYQVPNQMWCFDTVDNTAVVEIRVEPEQYKISLEEIDSFAIDFFDGVEARAPSAVQFEVNDNYTASVSLSNAITIDGYNGPFDPSQQNTGSIKQFVLPRETITQDGYGNELLESISIKFTGQNRYCLGELESLVTTDLVNSQCRVILNGEELFRSPTESGPFARYHIRVNEGLILVYYNGKCVTRYPIVFQEPTFQFGATGKVFDDLVKADFRNVFVDRYFVDSPAKIEKVGRYIEIEGTVIS